MMLKLKKTLLLSGLGLIAIGAIAPTIASCSKNNNPKTESTQAPVYDAAVVQSLFEQFVQNYRALALSKMDSTYDETDIEEKIADFEVAYEAIKIELHDKYAESEVYGAIAKWVKDLATEYDIVLIEWSNVENNREVIRESTLANANYSDEVTYAANLQDDLFDQGIDENKSFNDYADDVAEYDPSMNSAILFPRSHGYTLRASNPLNSKLNAAAAKSNLLSQTIGDYLKLSDTTNLLTYFTTTTDQIFEDGIMLYNTNGAKLNYAKTTTQIVGENGNYIDAKNTAYRVLTPTAAAALFQYSYLDFDLEDNARVFKPFDGTKVFESNSYTVSIAMHINSTDPTGVELLGYDNYETLTSTFEYDVIVTDTKSNFSVFKDDNKTRYEDTDPDHKINYFGLVGSRTAQVEIPANILAEHGNDYLTDTLGYNTTTVETIVNAFGFTLPNIKSTDRESNGRPKATSKLSEEIVSKFYYCSSEPEELETGETQALSFTEKYGTNANIASVVGKWLDISDIDAAIRLQVKFEAQTTSKFGIEYNATNDVDLSSLTISEANIFLNSVLGNDALQFGVKIEAAGNDSPVQNPGSQAYVTLGVYIASTKTVNGVKEYTEIAPIASHNNETTNVDANSNISSIVQYVQAHVRSHESYNQLFFPLFLSETQVADSKFCNDLLGANNLSKHAKIMNFIDVDNIQNFTDKIDELITLNTTYYIISISMVVLYGLKAIFDAITIAVQWMNPVALVSAIVQLASDILSIVFLSLSISDTAETIDRTTNVFEVFTAYLEKDRNDPTVGYNLIKSKYDAYMAELDIFKDPATNDSLRLAAASRAHTKYNSFANALTSNLFNFIDDSIKQALKMDPGFDGSFQWSVFEGVNEFAPYFIISVVLNVLVLVIINVFVRVVGIVLSAAEKASNVLIGKSLSYVFQAETGAFTDISTVWFLNNFNNSNWLTQLSIKLGSRYAQTLDATKNFTNFVNAVKPMMKISGIAGVILGVMDMLFVVGYSIASSVLAADVNDLISALV